MDEGLDVEPLHGDSAVSSALILRVPAEQLAVDLSLGSASPVTNNARQQYATWQAVPPKETGIYEQVVVDLVVDGELPGAAGVLRQACETPVVNSAREQHAALEAVPPKPATPSSMPPLLTGRRPHPEAYKVIAKQAPLLAFLKKRKDKGWLTEGQRKRYR